MKDKDLECLAKQAIEKVVAHLETVKTRVEHTVYTDDFYLGFQFGFYLYYDSGIKDYRIYASARNKEGFAARRERYNRQELCLEPEFVSALVEEYIHLMRVVDIDVRDYDNRGLWEEERVPFTSSVSIQESCWVTPLPFECSVTDELYESLGVARRRMIDAVQKIVNHCKKEREHYIAMHTHCWWAVECILTRVLGNEIGVRIRYDAQMGGGFCPICRDEDGIYWQMETYSYLHIPDDMEFVKRLADYYVFLLSLQRGLISTDKPIEKFSKEHLSTIKLFGVWGRGTILI